jgi:hypothetical protein
MATGKPYNTHDGLRQIGFTGCSGWDKRLKEIFKIPYNTHDGLWQMRQALFFAFAFAICA